MTFYQAVNEIRKLNPNGDFLYLNPNLCDVRDKLVLFCDSSQLRSLPNGFQIVNSKLVDTNVNPNKEYEIRSLSILKNIEVNSEYRVFPQFNSETKVNNTIKEIIDEIKKLNVEVVDGISKEITILYDESRNTFVCNRKLSSLKLPKEFVKLGDSLFKTDNNQYGFYYCNPLLVTNYSSYIYPNISSKVCSNINELANLMKLLNPNCKVGFDNDKIYCTIQINELVMPDGYLVDTNGLIKYNGNVFCHILRVSEAELNDKINRNVISSTSSNVFKEIATNRNKEKKHIVYELDANGNYIYENGKKKTREGTFQEKIENLKRARASLIARKEAATKESIQKSDMMAEAFFNGRKLATENNSQEYERVVNDLNTKIQALPIGDKNRINYEIELSEFNKGYNFNKTKEVIERRQKHIIVKKEYTSKNQEAILIGSSIMFGAGMVLFKQENPAAFFEYVETEKFKKGKKERKPGFIARGCKKLVEKLKYYSNVLESYDFMNEEEVDINAYARRSFNS